MQEIDDKTRTELEAAAFRRLVEHLRERTDVQNIDMMNLAGFCRNCLSRWYREAADERGGRVERSGRARDCLRMPVQGAASDNSNLRPRRSRSLAFAGGNSESPYSNLSKAVKKPYTSLKLTRVPE